MLCVPPPRVSRRSVRLLWLGLFPSTPPLTARWCRLSLPPHQQRDDSHLFHHVRFTSSSTTGASSQPLAPFTPLGEHPLSADRSARLALLKLCPLLLAMFSAALNRGPVSSIQHLHDAAFSLAATSTSPHLPLLPSSPSPPPQPPASLTFFRLSSVVDSSPTAPTSHPPFSSSPLPLSMLRINVELTQPLMPPEAKSASDTPLPIPPPSTSPSLPALTCISHIATFTFRVHVRQHEVSSPAPHLRPSEPSPHSPSPLLSTASFTPRLPSPSFTFPLMLISQQTIPSGSLRHRTLSQLEVNIPATALEDFAPTPACPAVAPRRPPVALRLTIDSEEKAATLQLCVVRGQPNQPSRESATRPPPAPSSTLPVPPTLLLLTHSSPGPPLPTVLCHRVVSMRGDGEYRCRVVVASPSSVSSAVSISVVSIVLLHGALLEYAETLQHWPPLPPHIRRLYPPIPSSAGHSSSPSHTSSTSHLSHKERKRQRKRERKERRKKRKLEEVDVEAEVTTSSHRHHRADDRIASSPSSYSTSVTSPSSSSTRSPHPFTPCCSCGYRATCGSARHCRCHAAGVRCGTCASDFCENEPLSVPSSRQVIVSRKEIRRMQSEQKMQEAEERKQPQEEEAAEDQLQ